MNKINVNLGSLSYSVNINYDDVINHDFSVLVVSNKNVASIYLDEILKKIKAPSVHVCIINDGEKYKTLDTIKIILNSAFDHRLDRKSLMVALGGGVVTDMVGFASGIYQRGIDFISIPTTLLAMVDASIGGKCGVNNEYGKNLIGLFHQPKAVFIYSKFLNTLGKLEFLSGLSEIIKIFACFEFDLLKNFNLNNLEFYIQKSIKLKAMVIERDERETNNLRALLNYGHTFAHVIETQTNYTKYLHGEAVSIGMIMANELSVELNILDLEKANLIKSLLKTLKLPIRYEIENVEAFYDLFFLDKKSINSKLNFVLLTNDNVQIHSNIEKKIIINVLSKFKVRKS